ncbi:protein maternal effect lethal 26-like isoform X2 [Paramacrobiotus metropolitanus]|uniref:protein maternal effect lethal 26-like isoform X2 n=1 Tax=Paramacrobiotus metropolitanus TaxID=2943436 RepID=UPI0024465052|nr:protein maternal effect lethal 26-like isoform X2 [Paramacrobiotus metropolitanus]
MPVLPVDEACALVLRYKIPTEQFVLCHLEGQCNTGDTYAVDITVEEQPNYAGILPSVWTVTLTISEPWGNASVTVTPKEKPRVFLDKNPRPNPPPPKEAKSGSNLMVDYAVRVRGSCDYKIESGKCSQVEYSLRNELHGLTVSVRSSCGKVHYLLQPKAHVLVNLILYPAESISNLETIQTSLERADLKRLRESQTLSDCTLVCADREFPVHRAILAAQSPVFAAMFQNGQYSETTPKLSRRSKQGVLYIDDIGADILDALLDFAYTRAPLQATNLTELWHAANTYDMDDLRAECVRRMISSITPDNAFQYFCLAREHGLTQLKVAAGKVIGQDPGNVT